MKIVDTFLKEKAKVYYGLDTQTHRIWDVIIMGDVLEHVSDPVLAIKKAHSMPNEGGVIWVSTPNFEGARV